MGVKRSQARVGRLRMHALSVTRATEAAEARTGKARLATLRCVAKRRSARTRLRATVAYVCSRGSDVPPRTWY